MNKSPTTKREEKIDGQKTMMHKKSPVSARAFPQGKIPRPNIKSNTENIEDNSLENREKLIEAKVRYELKKKYSQKLHSVQTQYNEEYSSIFHTLDSSFVTFFNTCTSLKTENPPIELKSYDDNESMKANLQEELDILSEKTEENTKLQQELEQMKILINQEEEEIKRNKDKMNELSDQLAMSYSKAAELEMIAKSNSEIQNLRKEMLIKHFPPKQAPISNVDQSESFLSTELNIQKDTSKALITIVKEDGPVSSVENDEELHSNSEHEIEAEFSSEQADSSDLFSDDSYGTKDSNLSAKSSEIIISPIQINLPNEQELISSEEHNDTPLQESEHSTLNTTSNELPKELFRAPYRIKIPVKRKA